MFSYQLEAAFLSYSVKIGADFHVVGRRCLCKCLSAVSAAATRLQKYHCNLSRSLRWKSAACPAMWIISVSVLGGLYEWALSTAVLLRHKHFLFFWAHDISIRIPMFRTLTNEQVKVDSQKYIIKPSKSKCFSKWCRILSQYAYRASNASIKRMNCTGHKHKTWQYLGAWNLNSS